MTCKQFRTDIALWVGNDLEDGQELRVERHVASCPQCREYAHEIKSSLHALQKPAVPDVGGSLWPRLSARIASLDSDRRRERFNGWLPAVTVVAASITIITLLEMQEPARTAGNGFIDVSPIAYPSEPPAFIPPQQAPRLDLLQRLPIDRALPQPRDIDRADAASPQTGSFSHRGTQ